MKATRRRARGWGAVLAATAAVLCLGPASDLLGLLGYEASFVLALVVSFAGAHLGASTVFDLRRSQPPSDGLWAHAYPLRALVRLWLGVTARLWGCLAIPLAVLALNALRVRNCAFGKGIAWFAVLPGLSAAMGSAAGVVAGLAVRRRLAATALAVAFVLGSLAWSVVRFYAAPPIFAYDPFGGYFPGTLYDEEVAIGAPLLWSRLAQLAGVLAALTVCATLLDGPRLALSLRPRRRALAAAALLTVGVALGLHAAHARLGFFYTAGDVARALGGEKRTAHFVLHYDPQGPFGKDIDLYAEDAELRWSQLQALFGVAPEPPVHAFLFDSPERKAQLMGAAHTYIAKPWRREIYLQAEGWPHPVLMHELAHVFAGRFGDPIFGISRAGGRINVGLIEGIAVAGAWKGAPLTPHQAVKAMREAHLEPPLGKVLSLQFLGLNASQAYNVAGSFARYLLDHYPARALGEVFHAAGGPDAWVQAYGKPFAALADEWSRFIDGVTVPAREAEVYRERVRRPSVFHKVCAHELALRREAARHAGDKVAALAQWDAVCADDPDEPQNLVDLMDAADAAGQADRAAVTARRVLDHPKVSDALRARAWALLGDLALRRHAVDEARADYERAAALPLDEASARLTTAKLIATRLPPGREADLLIGFLAQPSQGRDAAIDLLNLRELVGLAPDRALYQYLFARQLEARGKYAQAADALDRALAGTLPDETFTREALRLLGRARFRADQPEAARAAFERLARDPQAQLDADDWLARLRFHLRAP